MATQILLTNMARLMIVISWLCFTLFRKDRVARSLCDAMRQDKIRQAMRGVKACE